MVFAPRGINGSMADELSASNFIKDRWRALDWLRGVAILAMIIYHSTWNLGYFRLINQEFLQTPWWRLLGEGIAASFLMISGVSLALAHGRKFRPASFLKRLLKLGIAAALVTSITWVVFPNSFIFFGILHCLAVTSVLAIPFLYAPIWLCAVASALILVLPLFLQQSFWDQTWLEWLGFGLTDPRTNDYAPIFPWFALVLFGVILGRTSSYLPRLFDPKLVDSLWFRRVAWMGRWSLVIYLVHQPILFGLTQAAAGLLTSPPTPAANFRQLCEVRCKETSANSDACYQTCACVTRRLTETQEYAAIWERIKTNKNTPQDREQVYQLAGRCFGEQP